MQFFSNHFSTLPINTGTIGVEFGDGSGMGTGGTDQLVSVDKVTPMKMRMGCWKYTVHSFSSNWKESKTFHMTLKRSNKTATVKDIMSFHFTDNIVSYYILQLGSSKVPELQKIVLESKQLKLSMKINGNY